MLYCSDRKYDTSLKYSGSLVTAMPSRTYPVSLPDFLLRYSMNNKPHPTQERLRELFIYDEDTGVFTRRVAVGRHGCYGAGVVAGTKSGHGYIVIGVDSKRYLAHRLAWIYANGTCPKQLDHVNGNGEDNRLCNLRPATYSQNMSNTKPRASKYGRGIYKNKSKYSVRINVDKKAIRLGTFETVEEAREAYRKGAKKYHGEFARIKSNE